MFLSFFLAPDPPALHARCPSGGKRALLINQKIYIIYMKKESQRPLHPFLPRQPSPPTRTPPPPPRSFRLLIGRVEPLPHSGAGDATSWRVLHVRLVLSLARESFAAVAAERSSSSSTSRREGVRSILDTAHPGRRAERASHSLCSSINLSLALPLFSLSFSLSISPSLAHTLSCPPARACTSHSLPPSLLVWW